jgi:hypothetical protein
MQRVERIWPGNVVCFRLQLWMWAICTAITTEKTWMETSQFLVLEAFTSYFLALESQKSLFLYSTHVIPASK